MSQENVEAAYRAYDAFNRRDLGAFLAVMDTDVKAVSRLAAVDGGYHGHDGIRRWWSNLLEAFPDFTMEVIELRDLGSLTIAELRTRGHGAGSDLPIEQTLWHVSEGRDGKSVWWSSFRTEAEALEAVGLSE
jgi:ketosteroid isomerase-like protein